jgi:malonyl-CoA O-methyltransferase
MTRVSGAALPARDAYRLWADTYDAENPVTTLEQRCVRVLTPRLTGCWLLDAACGTGRRMPRTGGPGAHRAIGADLVFEMVRRAQHATVAVADVNALPFGAELFHVVWCRLALGHVAELEPAYAELARVARPEAHIIVSDFHPAAARAGHTRTFRDAQGELHAVEHHLHETSDHVAAARRAGLTLDHVMEPAVGRGVRRFYEAAGRLDIYAQQVGLPLVLALSFRA